MSTREIARQGRSMTNAANKKRLAQAFRDGDTETFTAAIRAANQPAAHVGAEDAGSVIDQYLAGDLTEGQGMAVLGLNRLDFRLRVEWREHDLRIRYDALGEAWAAVNALVEPGYYDPMIDRALAAISALREDGT